MATLQQLLRSTGALRTNVNPTADFGVSKLLPIPPSGALVVQGRFTALTDRKHMKFYEPTIIFLGIEYTNKKDGQHPKSVEVTPGAVLFYNQPSLTRSDCMVVCQCMDYKFTWGYYNRQEGSDIMKYDYSYTRKTPPPPEGYPYRNPTESPGLCKHLIRLGKYLKDKGFVTG